jgi:aminopeptidase-like protein
MPEAPARGLSRGLDPERAGAEAVELMHALYPLRRSLTGDGVRETLRLVSELLPLELVEVPTGTELFDWTVPREWNLDDAWIADAEGRRLVDLRESTLHVVGYSRPVRARLRGSELQAHLHSLPARPELIPYRTAYWEDTWGFCVTEAQRGAIDPEAGYEVCIEARLEDGHLTYGEALLPGRSGREVLLSTYVCHPALCNDNLSGVALLAVLGRHLAGRELRYSYRFLFGPGTLGPLAWLARNRERLGSVAHGLAVSCCGDPGPLTYKRSRRGDAEVDRAAAHVLRHTRPDARVEGFAPWGGDERQFCSPGFDLPVGALTRTPHGRYPEYHTSADDFALVRSEHLADSLDCLLAIFDVLERNAVYESLSPCGEPQLGRRGLYDGEEGLRRALLWTLNLADGRHALLDVAERAGLTFAAVAEAADALVEAELLREVSP